MGNVLQSVTKHGEKPWLGITNRETFMDFNCVFRKILLQIAADM